ncbi:CYTH and CHAD domain-containing protein [Chelatococcus reniformis]|uniref:Inorganic triphosphatase n=1 Tax=Chelatococcus reniformis TaxID=1494448 RepID=A0A916UUW4_9HYPH|nr:CHAD domain-containing protein [Chelatococcus reniformis]GGC87890.1 inorganic triphosphatase [Chelatococcus reniformis]
MSEPKEIELKLICNAADMCALQASTRLQGAAAKDEDQLNSAYFDTPDRLLQEAGYILRVRRSRDGYVQTAKAAGDGLIERSEWERAVSGPEPDLDGLRKTPLAKVLGKRPTLVPLFTVSVERGAYEVERANSRIEVAMDRGGIVAPGAKRKTQAVSISEIELELKNGSAADLFALAREFADEVPLRLGVRSKAERGFALADGKGEGVRKAEPILLSDDLTAAEAFRAIAHACLRHMRLNEDVLLDHRDASALHQMRVAIRRLRSSFSLFKDLIADDRSEVIHAELKRLSEPLGRARNLDVFLSDTLPAERARHPDKVELLNLEKHLEAQRLEAYRSVMRGLQSEEWPRFVLDLLGWINAGPWLSSGGRKGALARNQPATAFAAGVLHKRRRQVKKRGRDLQNLNAEDRHKVRIAAKKLRYGAEFFAGLYTGRKERGRQKAFTTALSDMQDSLGALNDIATGHEIIDEIVGAGADSSASFAAGLTMADIEARSQRLLASAAEAHTALVEVRPFWR